jgi:hypothetical protein
MKRIQQIARLAASTFTTFAVLGAGLAVQPMLAKGHTKKLGYTLVGQTALPNAKATDLFLRRDDRGHKYLYVVYATDTLAVLNVTNGAEVTEVNRLALATNTQTPHVEPVSARFVVLTNAAAPERDLAVVDTSTPATPEIAKEFKNADCYTIDSSDETLYVVRDGELSIMRFDHPISRDAELFEQMLEAR